MAKTTRKGKKTTIDFGGVEGQPGQRRSGRRHIPEGDYFAKISKVDPHRSEAGSRSFRWQFQIVSDAAGNEKYKGTTFFYYTSLKPEALFNLRNLIFAASDGKKNVTGKQVDFDPQALVGRRIGVIVEDEEYQNKIQSRVVDIQPPSAIEPDEEDEDEEDEDYEEEEEDEDELDDVDLDEDM